MAMAAGERRISASLPGDSISTSRAGISIVRVASWVAFALGSIASVNQPQVELVIAAAFCGVAFPIATSLIRTSRLSELGATLYIVSLMGAVSTTASVALTGNIQSPYLLLALMPALFASITEGFRAGVLTALLSSILIAVVITTTDGFELLGSTIGSLGLFPLVALVVAQIRSLLVRSEQRASELAAASQEVAVEMALLSQANDLLRRLTGIYGQGITNPIQVGRRVIETVLDSFPGGFATATIFDNDGPVVVARAGSDSPSLHRYQFPLDDGTATSGVVSLGTPRPLTDEERSEIHSLMRPLSVAFANTLLLQQIAEEAVREERLRLARELHDEVGPSLAALGLTLDGVVLDPSAELRIEAANVRRGLTRVVEDLRTIIADLRSERQDSLVASLASEAAGYSTPPEVAIEVRERRPPPPSVTRQLLAVLIEALRNAYHHASAQKVTIRGTVERRYVHLTVTDDGTGFDPKAVSGGHFGLMGMRERADKIGATLSIDATPQGTTVTVTWRNPE